MEKKEKIFCKDCKYLFLEGRQWCFCKKKIVKAMPKTEAELIKEKITGKIFSYSKEGLLSLEIANKDNDCKYFKQKRKWYKLFLK